VHHPQRRRVRPLEVVDGDRDPVACGPEILDEVDDAVDQAELELGACHVGRSDRRRLSVEVAVEQPGDLLPSAVGRRRGYPEAAGDGTEGAASFQLLRARRERLEAVLRRHRDGAAEQLRLSDPGLAVEQEDASPARSHSSDECFDLLNLGPATDQPTALHTDVFLT
jgi:hypothetical protein